MKGLWKRTKQLLRMKDADVGPSLRKKLLAVNGVLIALFLSSIWMRYGYPLPTMEMEFRRLERTHLMPRSEIVFQTGKRYQTLPLAAEGPKVQLQDRWVVGLWERGAVVLAEEQYRSGRSSRSFYPNTAGGRALPGPSAAGREIFRGSGPLDKELGHRTVADL